MHAYYNQDEVEFRKKPGRVVVQGFHETARVLWNLFICSFLTTSFFHARNSPSEKGGFRYTSRTASVQCAEGKLNRLVWRLKAWLYGGLRISPRGWWWGRSSVHACPSATEEIGFVYSTTDDPSVMFVHLGRGEERCSSCWHSVVWT